MTLKPYAIVDTSDPPTEVRDEEGAVLMATGPRYWLCLSDDQIENLADGIVPEAIATRAFRMLEWKRGALRVTTRALARKGDTR